MSARIEWLTAPPRGCIDTHAVEQTIGARLGRSVFAAAADALLIQARFAESAGQQTVQLEISSASGQRLGERELTVRDCEELRAALPVVIAVMLDLHAETNVSAAEGTAAAPALARSPAASAVHSPATRAELSQTGAGDTLPAPDIALAVSVEAVSGLQPGVAAGIGLGVAVSVLGPFEIAAWGSLRLPSSTGATSEPGLGLQSGSAGAGLCAGGRLVGKLAAGGCAGGGGLWLHASGRGLSRMLPADDRWVAELRLFGRLDYPLSESIFARLETGGLWPLQRPRYRYSDESNDGTLSSVQLYRPSLPGQEFGTSSNNHRAFAALDRCKPDGAPCATGIDCCLGTTCDIQNGPTATPASDPIGTCSAPPVQGCAKRDERCASDAECCPPQTANEPPNLCIAGFCAFVPLL